MGNYRHSLDEGLPTPPKMPTEGLPQLWETFGRTEWLGRETGHSGCSVKK